jgi:23S rRNA (cytidine1920-2'-O)/16S rRNA (cytidine1409-2'-O)-methyltransferase
MMAMAARDPSSPPPSGRRRVPLWQAVLEAGLAEGEAAARALILAGQVLVDGQRIDKPGTPVRPGQNVQVRGVRAFASRGGYKLQAALEHFRVQVRDRVALDAGASTGGFTDCLLQWGAARVYAVDIGYGQLLGRLRQDPRVVNLERTHLRDVGPGLDPLPTLVTLDLSYLPLAAAWRMIDRWLPAGGEVIALVKPLFEVDDPLARRTGRIEGTAPYVAVLRRLVADAEALGWSVLGCMASPLRGSGGTVEFLLYLLRQPGRSAALDLQGLVQAALNAAGGALDPPAGALRASR